MKYFSSALFLLVWSSWVYAHLLPKQNATINIVENSAYIVVSVPASSLKGLDDDSNGSLSVQEIQKHTRAIELQVAARLHVSAQGMVGKPVLTMVMAPHTDGTVDDSDYIIVMHRVNFPDVPSHPSIATDLFGTKQGEAQMTITATYGKQSEVAMLESTAPSYTFFRGGWEVFTHFVRIGTTHILAGLDHLLFLLTIIIGAAGWRYWLAVITSFTLAHSITLSVSALNIVRLPSTIVEPGIALSIVLMALLNLYHLYKPAPAHLARDRTLMSGRVALVFACGLLHGFGFASAIGAISKDTGSRLATLAGFNIGIEVGQFLFLAAILLTSAVLSKAGLPKLFAQLPKLASGSAAFLGLGLLVQQLLGLSP
jgi:hydrogenase/urease accessory protein HupE